MLKIMVIKLGALGDVVRTLSILPAIKEKYPGAEISWVTKPDAAQLCKNNPYVNKVFTIPYKINPEEKFDILYNFDVDEDATKLALEIKADKKYGFYLEEGFPASFNISSEYYLNTMFDDDLKKKNKKTYHEMIFEVAELEYNKQHCEIYLTKADQDYAESFAKKNRMNKDNLIGIHLGASSRWPSKVWHSNNLKEFIIKAKKSGYEIILFAGPNEIEKHREILNELKKEGINIYQNNPKNTIREFASLVNLCKLMVCSDSLALHVSIALKKPTIGLFFCTSPHEIEDYGLLKKIVSFKLEDFFPEKMNEYDEELVKSILAETVLREVEDIMGKSGQNK